MGGGWIMEFKKIFVKCIVPGCKRKHYARGYCERHYHQNCRGEYRYSLQEYQDMKLAQQLKESAKNKIKEKLEIFIKSKPTKEFYQKLKEANITVFQYKDIMNIVGWKYERIKKHVLKLVKLCKIVPIGGHFGGGRKQSIFRICP